MTFEEWYKNADMPEYDTKRKVWFDMEDGIDFNASVKNYTTFVMTDEVKKLRAFARQFGGKALTGTAKQKEWAEKIRAEKLKEMTGAQASISCRATQAKFWIENRQKSAVQIFDEINEAIVTIAHNNKVTKEYNRYMEKIGVGVALSSEQSAKLREIENKYI